MSQMRLKFKCHYFISIPVIDIYFLLLQHVHIIFLKLCSGLTAEEVLKLLNLVQNFIPVFDLVSVSADGVKLTEVGHQLISETVLCPGAPIQSL